LLGEPATEQQQGEASRAGRQRPVHDVERGRQAPGWTGGQGAPRQRGLHRLPVTRSTPRKPFGLEPGCFGVLSLLGGVVALLYLFRLPLSVALNSGALKISRIYVVGEGLAASFSEAPDALVLHQPTGLHRSDGGESLHLRVPTSARLAGVVLVLEGCSWAVLLSQGSVTSSIDTGVTDMTGMS